jgi:ATP/maltotriose-dependent transcriptional regulator MalT
MAAVPGAGETDLVEREREVRALDALLHGALDGDGRVALIEGPAGIGKSRLLQLARRRGEAAGALTLGARSSELEREFPYGVVRQLFEGLLADPAQRARMLDGAAGAAGPVFGAPAADSGDASFATLHGLYWLMLNVASDRPLVLAIDDLHWCDRPSLRFLAYVARRLDGLPVLLAVTLRTTEPGTDPALLSDIANDQATSPVRPGPLTDAAVRALVRATLVGDADDVFCAAVHGATGGNPLLVRQLLRALEAEGTRPDAASAGIVREIGPSAVARTVLVRLARQPAEALAVARAVAVLGEGASLAAVAALAEVDEAAVAHAAGTLARAEILRAEPPLGFVHALVRDAVYREMPHGERALWHGRAVGALQALGAPSGQVAAQLLSVPPRGDDQVAELLHAAGREAFARGAPDSAIGLLARALDEPPAPERRPGILLDLGLAETLVDGRAAAGHLRDAYDALDDPVARAHTAVVLTQVLTFTGAPEESYALARRAIGELGPELRDVRRRLEAQAAVAVQWGAGLLGELDALVEQRAGIDEPGAGARMLEAMIALNLAYQAHPAEESVRLVERAYADGSLLEEDDGLFTVVVLIVLGMADREQALDVIDAMVERSHQRGSQFGMLAVSLWQGWLHLRRGELVDAGESLRTALAELAVWHGAAGGDIYAAAHYAQTQLEQGDLDGAWRTLDPGLREQLWTSLEGARWWSAVECELLLASGRAEEALERSERMRVENPHVDNPLVSSWRSPHARALHRVGRTAEALALAEDNLAVARRYGAPSAMSRALRDLGEMRGDDGIPLLQEAVDVLDGTPARLEQAKAHAALGRALRHARRPAEARDPLRRALELADACGAAGLAEDVRTELYAAGARPRTAALSGAGALTASERRVAALAAEGSSNRDIAQTLFVTPKTVEVHLSNAYRKLGIRSRRELAAALAPQPGTH